MLEWTMNGVLGGYKSQYRGMAAATAWCQTNDGSGTSQNQFPCKSNLKFCPCTFRPANFSHSVDSLNQACRLLIWIACTSFPPRCSTPNLVYEGGCNLSKQEKKLTQYTCSRKHPWYHPPSLHLKWDSQPHRQTWVHECGEKGASFK